MFIDRQYYYILKSCTHYAFIFLPFSLHSLTDTLVPAPSVYSSCWTAWSVGSFCHYHYQHRFLVSYLFLTWRKGGKAFMSCCNIFNCLPSSSKVLRKSSGKATLSNSSDMRNDDNLAYGTMDTDQAQTGAGASASASERTERPKNDRRKVSLVPFVHEFFFAC